MFLGFEDPWMARGRQPFLDSPSSFEKPISFSGVPPAPLASGMEFKSEWK
jgi:hypothetical protein